MNRRHTHSVKVVSQHAGFAAAAKDEINKRRTFEFFSDGASYDFLPLAGESFGSWVCYDEISEPSQTVEQLWRFSCSSAWLGW